MKRTMRYLALQLIIICVLTKLCTENVLLWHITSVTMKATVIFWLMLEVKPALRAALDLMLCWFAGAKLSHLASMVYHSVVKNLWFEVYELLEYLFVSSDIELAASILLYVECEMIKNDTLFELSEAAAQMDIELARYR